MTLLILHLAIVLGIALAVLLGVDMLRARRPPATTLGWLLLLFTLPWLAVPLYLALGSRKLSTASGSKAPLFPTADELPKHADALERVLAGSGIPPVLPGNRVRFHPDGACALNALLTLIDGARARLDLCLFLLADDDVGTKLAFALLAAARRGVRVRLLLDGVGSFLLSRRRVRELARGGVDLAWFIPVFHRPLRGRTNLRNHRKLAIADGARAWTGGRNGAKEYFADDGRWIDLSLDLEGPAVQRMLQVFAADWAFATGKPLEAENPFPAMTHLGESRVQVVPSGPDTPGEPLHDLLLTAAYSARHRIRAVSPYFIPDEALQRALCLAALRGLTVELILPRQSNHRVADIGRERYLRELSQYGVRVYLVPETMVHAKGVVIDDTLALVGSANLDLRSLYLNFELMCLFRSFADIEALDTWIDRLRRLARPYQPAHAGYWREIFEGLVLLLAFQL